MARAYGGRTAGERAAERRDRLVGAAFELVADGGWLQLSIEALCRQAGLNKRYFYESFAGLDGVIAAVTRRLADDAIAAALADVDPGVADEEVIHSAIAAFVGHLTDEPRRARVLFGAVPGGDAVAAHRAAAIRQVIETVASQGRERNDLGDHPVVDVAAAMLVGGTSQAVLDWLDGRVDAPRDELVAHLALLWQVIGDGATARAHERG